MNIAEIRELTTPELLERMQTETAKLVQMRINHAVTPLDSPAQIKEQRKTVARLKTEIRSRELNN